MPLYIYRSSAGSGKTFTLVKEYLKIVLKNPYDFKHTLAITFTNKATGEMKSRILKELKDLSAGKRTAMREAIEKEWEGSNIHVDLQANAVLTLENILFNYSRFEISTIDSFFTGIIRAFSKELRLPFNYSVDLDSKKALEYAMERLYDDLGINADLAAWLEEYIYNTLDNDKGWNIDYNIARLGEELFKEKFNALHEGEVITISDLKQKVKDLQQIISKFKAGISKPAREALKLIEDRGLNLAEFKSGTASIFLRVTEGDFSLSRTFLKLANGDKETWCSQKAPYKEQIDEIAGELNQFAFEVLDYREKHILDVNSANEALKNIYAYGLLHSLNEKIRDYRDENNLLLIADSNLLIKEIVANQEAPFIFEKVGSQYKHILIDEFQDTSDFQWNNLMPLVINSLSHNSNVLIVGDVKQSIYRWRGGNMKLLLQKVQQDLQAFAAQTQVEDLKYNFRSCRNIVNFNNAFFETAKELLKNTEGFGNIGGDKIIELAYESVAQIPMAKEEGFVKARFIDKEETEELEQEAEDDLKPWQRIALQETAATIALCLQQGYQYQDILILLEKNAHMSLVSTFLNEQGIPFVSQNSLLVANGVSVKLLINLIRFLNDTNDRIAYASLLWLNYRMIKGSHAEEDILHDLFKKKDEQQVQEYFKLLPPAFHEKYLHLKYKPIYELLEELIIIFNLDSGNDPFLQRLLDLALEQSGKGINSTASFLEFWNEKMDELCITTPAGLDAVSLLTIHRSKGLEAPVVIIPFACFEMKPKTNSTFWADNLEGDYAGFKVLPLNYTKSLSESHFAKAYYHEMLEGVLERLNVAYVGLTRPRERLYLFSEKFNIKNLNEPNPFNKLLYQVFTNPDFSLGGYWNESTWTFVLGEEKTNRTPKEEKEGLSELISTGTLTSEYTSKISIRSDADRFFTLLDNRQSENISMGHKLHAVLERMGAISDLENVLENLIFEGKITAKDKVLIKEKIDLLFQNSTFSSWFAPHWKVFSEREIFYQGRAYKPDRVIVSPEETIVIDYKKSKPNDAYKHQVRRYAELLQKTGYQNVRKFLVYVENQLIEEVV